MFTARIKTQRKMLGRRNKTNIINFVLVLLISSACRETDDPVLVEKEIMVVSEMDSQGIYQLYIREIDGNNPVQLTFNEFKSWMPAICPDREKVAYVLQQTNSLDIWYINLDGSNNRKITNGGMNIVPAWTPDGEYIYFTHSMNPAGVPPRIHKMKSDGSGRERVTKDDGDFAEWVPSLSPDASRIVFASDRSGPEKFEIWKANIDGTGLVRLTEAGYDDEIGANIQMKVPAWSPDGSKIAMWRGVEMTELAKDGGERDRKIQEGWIIHLVNQDGSGLTALDQGDDPCWTNDGQYIIHPDPLNRDQNPPGIISVKKTRVDGTENTTLFRTRKGFARMNIGYMWVESR
jgi:Tol biopolymer transport system component